MLYGKPSRRVTPRVKEREGQVTNQVGPRWSGWEIRFPRSHRCRLFLFLSGTCCFSFGEGGNWTHFPNTFLGLRGSPATSSILVASATSVWSQRDPRRPHRFGRMVEHRTDGRHEHEASFGPRSVERHVPKSANTCAHTHTLSIYLSVYLSIYLSTRYLSVTPYPYAVRQKDQSIPITLINSVSQHRSNTFPVSSL